MPQTLGAERAMVLRCTNWGMQIGRFLTSILTPLIASTWGWRAVPLVYAAFTAATTLPWEAWASDTPSSWNGWPRMGAAERALLTESPAGGSTATAESKLEARPFPWRLLASKPAIAPILMHTADNMGTYTFSYWSPTYFQQQFKISPTATGAYLASTHLFSIAGGFVAPLLEVAFLNAGADPLKVVRGCYRRGRHSIYWLRLLALTVANAVCLLLLLFVLHFAATFCGGGWADNAGCLPICYRVCKRSSLWSRVQRDVQLFQ